jgi:hypothetical protein
VSPYQWKNRRAEPEDLASKIKLSDSSYLSPDSFVNSDWYYHFKKDLETASAIVFMGYSMYDMDVKKFLFENPSLQEKTYFIVRNGADFKEVFTLRKYGYVLPIGIEGFSALVENLEKYQEEDGVIFTDSLIKHDIFETEPEFRDIDSERLFFMVTTTPKNCTNPLGKLSHSLFSSSEI